MDFIKKSLIRELFDNAPADSINLGLGEIQFPLSTTFKTQIADLVKEEEARYTPNGGLLSTRLAVARSFGKSLDENNVCITVGAESALYIITATLLNEGDEVLITNPSYPAYNTLVKMQKATPVTVNLEEDLDFRFNIETLLSQISPRTQMILISNPSNPLGKTLSDNEISKLIDICEAKNILLVVDEIYRKLHLNKPIDTLLWHSKNVIVVSGLSKSHCLSGWRTGWIITQDPEIISKAIRYQQYLLTCPPFISQKIIEIALSPSGKTMAEQIRTQLIENYNYTKDLLKNHRCRILEPDAAPYLFVNIGEDAELYARKLLKMGVIVIPGKAFGSSLANWIRINYGIDKDKLIEGLKRLSAKIK